MSQRSSRSNRQPPAAAAVATSLADDTLLESPGALRGETVIEINTRQAQRLLLGRPVKKVNGRQVHPGVIGVRRFATLMRQVVVGARADDPYADLCLIALDKEIQTVTKNLEDMLEDTKRCLGMRPAVNVQIAMSVEPLHVKLRFHSAYGYRAAYLVADYDELAAAVLSAHHSALMARSECENRIHRGRRLVRRVFSIPMRYRYSGASRQDVLQMTARGAAAIDKYGPVPDAVLQRIEQPEYGTTRLSDGSPILDTEAPADATLD